MLKSSLYLNKDKKFKQSKVLILALFLSFGLNAQIANYVSNGGFEEYSNSPNINVKFWSDVDSVTGQVFYHNTFGTNPINGFGYQWPRSGNSYVLGDFLCVSCNPENSRTYIQNRLKSTLIENKKYCVKLYVNLGNSSSYGIDAIGAFFGNQNVDTIKKGWVPLTYLNPQISNANNNIITDTLRWSQITGTFTADGTEKYLIIGNFKSNSATNILLMQPTYSNNVFSTILIDDVSCIPIDLPANAGEDKHIIPGETLYIGRQRDVGIDEACMWYKLPVTITPTTPAIDTAAGIFVSPIVTTTYVVKQDICGVVKYDTVVVFKDGVGLDTQSGTLSGVRLYPNPASNILYFETQSNGGTEGHSVQLFNALGQLVREEELNFKEKQASIDVADLQVGIYTIKLQAANSEVIYKRIVINK